MRPLSLSSARRLRWRIGAKLGSEDLTFAQSFTWGSGHLSLRNVGFAANGTGSRDPDGDKDDDLRIQITIDALSPEDGTPVTTTAYLGKKSPSHRESVVLTPLYKAGDMPAALRFSTSREENIGGDSWGTASANELITQFPSLIIFNDLSLEHGGKFGKHTAHQDGRSIDLRYPGPDGDNNPLNGQSGDEAAIARKNRWAQARSGNVPALQEMIVWLKVVRARFDAIFAATQVDFIYVGNALWNQFPIRKGTFGDGAPIVDPNTHQALGPWSPAGKIIPWADHLDHAHIQVKPRTQRP